MSQAVSEDERHQRWLQLTYEDYPPPERLFAVVSWGCAATNWLANVLNDCPGIFCLHQSSFYWEKFAGATALSGPDYFRIVAMLGTAARAAGEVHGIARHDIPHLQEAYGDRFRATILVRDPLPRLRSQLALFDRYSGISSWDVDYLEPKFPAVIGGLPTGSYDEKLFVHGINMLNTIVEEQTFAPIIRMEDVTSNPESLLELVDYLTSGAIQAPADWAQAAVASGKTNRHAASEEMRFADWQKRVIAGVLDPLAIEAYQKLGYTVDFDKPFRP